MVACIYDGALASRFVRKAAPYGTLKMAVIGVRVLQFPSPFFELVSE